jgi:hypothetical protein
MRLHPDADVEAVALRTKKKAKKQPFGNFFASLEVQASPEEGGP